MIITDGIHLISDTDEDELHKFAQSIELKRCWYRARSFPHYDLNTKVTEATVMKAGAVLVAPRDLVLIIRKRRMRDALLAVAKAAKKCDIRRLAHFMEGKGDSDWEWPKDLNELADAIEDLKKEELIC